MKSGSEVVMIIPHGRWVWTRALDCVEFVPKGKRRPTLTVHLIGYMNNRYGAVLTASRNVSKALLKVDE